MKTLSDRKKRDMSFIGKVFRFYYEGFRDMSWWGRRVWIIILIKLFIMFFVFKILFFPDFLKKKFDSDAQRSEYILEQLTNSSE